MDNQWGEDEEWNTKHICSELYTISSFLLLSFVLFQMADSVPSGTGSWDSQCLSDYHMDIQQCDASRCSNGFVAEIRSKVALMWTADHF